MHIAHKFSLLAVNEMQRQKLWVLLLKAAERFVNQQKVFQSAWFRVARRLLFFIFMSSACKCASNWWGHNSSPAQQHIGLGAKQNIFPTRSRPSSARSKVNISAPGWKSHLAAVSLPLSSVQPLERIPGRHE
jgi:hypothetical protein